LTENDPALRSSRLGLRALYSCPRCTPSGNQRRNKAGKADKASALIAAKVNA